jgi:hypothetical protein
VKLCYILESSTERALLLKGINCAKVKKNSPLPSPPSTVPPALTRWGQLIIIVQWAVIAFFFLACLIFGIVITVIVVILKKLFYKKYFLLRIV